MVQAGLVAADAGVDAVGGAGRSLVHEVGVGQEGPRHRHHVRLPVGQDLFGDLGGVDPVAGDQGDRDLALELLGDPRERRSGHARGDRRDAGLVPADAGVQDRHPGRLEGLRQLDHLGQGGAALDQVQHGQPEDDDELVADPLTDLSHDLEGEPDAVVVRPAPLVGPLVGPGGDELVDQVPLRAHDLDPVVARLLRQDGARGEVGDRPLDVGGGHLARREGRDRGLDRTRGDELGVIGVPAEVQDLHGDQSALGVDRVGDDPVLLRLLRGGQRRAHLPGPGFVVGGDATGDDQRHAAPGPLRVELRHPLETVLGLFESHVHRAHQDPVGQRDETQVERLEQVRVGTDSGHGALLAGCRAAHRRRRGWVPSHDARGSRSAPRVHGIDGCSGRLCRTATTRRWQDPLGRRLDQAGHESAPQQRRRGQRAAEHGAGDATRHDVLARQVQAGYRRGRFEEALAQSLRRVLQSVQLAVRVPSEVLRGQRRGDLGQGDLAPQLRQLRVERLQHAIGQALLERVVVLVAVLPAAALPALEPLVRRRGDDVDRGVPGVTAFEVGVLGRRERHVDHRKLGFRVLAAVPERPVVVVVRVDPQVVLGEVQFRCGLLEAEVQAQVTPSTATPGSGRPAVRPPRPPRAAAAVRTCSRPPRR